MLCMSKKLMISFEYWLHNGSVKGKGELQMFIDELLKIIDHNQRGYELTWTEKEIIYETRWTSSMI